MRESYGDGLAGHTVPESCVGAGNRRREALTGVRAGWPVSRERFLLGTEAAGENGRPNLWRLREVPGLAVGRAGISNEARRCCTDGIDFVLETLKTKDHFFHRVRHDTYLRWKQVATDGTPTKRTFVYNKYHYLSMLFHADASSIRY